MCYTVQKYSFEAVFMLVVIVYLGTGLPPDYELYELNNDFRKLLGCRE